MMSYYEKDLLRLNKVHEV